MTINANTNNQEAEADEKVPSSSLRFLLLGSGDRRHQLVAEAEKVRPVIEKFGSVVLEDLTYQKRIDVDADFAIVIGGDGSILRSAKQMGAKQIPVIGINFGKLGFLADIHPSDLESTLAAVASNQFRIVEHLMIRCQVFADDEMVCDELGLNEVAILGGPPYSIHYIDLYVD